MNGQNIWNDCKNKFNIKCLIKDIWLSKLQIINLVDYNTTIQNKHEDMEQHGTRTLTTTL